MCYPAIVELSNAEAIGTAFAGTIFATQYYTTFLGIPVLLPSGGYTSTVVPIIVAVFFAVKLEKLLQKVIPNVVKMFFVPLFTLIIIVPLTFLVIGPITGILCASSPSCSIPSSASVVCWPVQSSAACSRSLLSSACTGV